MGVRVAEYRRGVGRDVRNKLWHWQEDCQSYPTKTFAIRHDTPDDDELCSRCHNHAQAMKIRPAA